MNPLFVSLAKKDWLIHLQTPKSTCSTPSSARSSQRFFGPDFNLVSHSKRDNFLQLLNSTFMDIFRTISLGATILEISHHSPETNPANQAREEPLIIDVTLSYNCSTNTGYFRPTKLRVSSNCNTRWAWKTVESFIIMSWTLILFLLLQDVFPNKVCLQLKIREVRQKMMAQSPAGADSNTATQKSNGTPTAVKWKSEEKSEKLYMKLSKANSLSLSLGHDSNFLLGSLLLECWKIFSDQAINFLTLSTSPLAALGKDFTFRQSWFIQYLTISFNIHALKFVCRRSC